MKTIEKTVADAVLQRKNKAFIVEGVEYKIGAPTPATLILISEVIAEMPTMDVNAKNILHEVLSEAKHLKVVGKIAAILVLGAKRVLEEKTIKLYDTKKERRFSWKKLRFVKVEKKTEREVNELEHLSKLFLENLSVSTLKNVIESKLSLIGIPDFFALTTSLKETSLTKTTREVEKMTVSGQ